MTFVGYASDSKAYRLPNTSTGQIVISHDVRFLVLYDEDKNFEDEIVCSLPGGECPNEDEQVAVRQYDCGPNAGRCDESQDEEKIFEFDEDNDDPHEAVPAKTPGIPTKDTLKTSMSLAVAQNFMAHKVI